MGTGKVTAKRSANGDVAYDTSQFRYNLPKYVKGSIGGVGDWQAGGGNKPPGPDALIGSMYEITTLETAKKAAFDGLIASEEAAARGNTASLASSAVSVGGLPTSTSAPGGKQGAAGYSNTSSSTRVPEGNPGMGDTGANSDIDLSTSDTTTRRKAGYRRDSGIRI